MSGNMFVEAFDTESPWEARWGKFLKDWTFQMELIFSFLYTLYAVPLLLLYFKSNQKEAFALDLVNCRSTTCIGSALDVV